MISCYYVLFTPMRPHGISRTKKKSNDFTLLFTSWILISYQKIKWFTYLAYSINLQSNPLEASCYLECITF